MPLIEPEDARKLVGTHAEGDQVLDLRGASPDVARVSIEQMLAEAGSKVRGSVVVRLDPATATSGETLFLPVGRQLLEARKQGKLKLLEPLPEANGGGFYIELLGVPAA